MSIYNKLEQRYPVELLEEFICSNKVHINSSDFQTSFENISCNKYYQKRLLKLFIDNPRLLDCSELESVDGQDEEDEEDDEGDAEDLQEWIQETYMLYLNVQFDPDLVDIIKYSIPLNAAGTDSISIKIREVPYKISGNNTTGFRTWEAALFLIYYLYHEDFSGLDTLKGNMGINANNQNSSFSHPLKVLELGSGTGICGLSLYKYPLGMDIQEVTLSDGSLEIVDDIIPFNLSLNRDPTGNNPTQIGTRQLLWGKEHFSPEWQNKYDLIIGADVTYDDRVIPLLVESIDYYLGLGETSQCLISATIRNESTIKVFVDYIEENYTNCGKLKIEKICDTKSIGEKTLEYFKQNVWFKDMIAPIRIYKISRV